MNIEIIMGEIVVLVLGCVTAFCVSRMLLTNKLLEAERKLRSRIANFESNYGDLKANPEGVVSEALGDMGIQGILQTLDVGNITPEMLKQLGLPSWLLPVAQGFLSKMKERGGNVTQQKAHISQTDM